MTVSGPGVAREPRVPQKATLTVRRLSQNIATAPMDRSTGAMMGKAVTSIDRFTPSAPTISNSAVRRSRSPKRHDEGELIRVQRSALRRGHEGGRPLLEGHESDLVETTPKHSLCGFVEVDEVAAASTTKTGTASRLARCRTRMSSTGYWTMRRRMRQHSARPQA